MGASNFTVRHKHPYGGSKPVQAPGTEAGLAQKAATKVATYVGAYIGLRTPFLRNPADPRGLCVIQGSADCRYAAVLSVGRLKMLNC